VVQLRRIDIESEGLDGVVEDGHVLDAVHDPIYTFSKWNFAPGGELFSDVRRSLHEKLSERRDVLVLEGDREAWPEHDPRRVRQRALFHLDAVLAGVVCVDDRELLDVVHGPSIHFLPQTLHCSRAFFSRPPRCVVQGIQGARGERRPDVLRPVRQQRHDPVHVEVRIVVKLLPVRHLMRHTFAFFHSLDTHASSPSHRLHYFTTGVQMDHSMFYI